MNILKYGAVRLAVFFVVFAACVLLQTGWILATVIAALAALAAGYLFFNTLRLKAAQDLARAWEGRPGQRGRTEQTDMDVEDAYTEGRFYDAAAARTQDVPDSSDTRDGVDSPQAGGPAGR